MNLPSNKEIDVFTKSLNKKLKQALKRNIKITLTAEDNSKTIFVESNNNPFATFYRETIKIELSEL